MQEVSNKNSVSDVRHSADHCESPSGCASTTASTPFRYFSLVRPFHYLRARNLCSSHMARCTLNRLMVCRTSYIFFVFPILDTTENGSLFCRFAVSSLRFWPGNKRRNIFIYLPFRPMECDPDMCWCSVFSFLRAHNTTNESNESAHAAIYIYTHVFLLRNSRKTSRCVGTLLMSTSVCLFFTFCFSPIPVRYAHYRLLWNEEVQLRPLSISICVRHYYLIMPFILTSKWRDGFSINN